MTILPWPPASTSSITNSNGSGIVVVNSDGSIAITPVVNGGIVIARPAPGSPNYGLFTIGNGSFDGTSAGHFAGNAIGTYIGINAANGYAGSLIDAQIAGAPILRVDASGSIIPIAPPATATRALLQIGNAPIDGTSPGHYTGAAAGGGFGANFASGYAGDLFNFQIAGVSQISCTSSGVLLTRFLEAGLVLPKNSSPVFPGLAIQGAASQTADLLILQDAAAHPQFAVANVGSGAAPTWALRVRAVANAESMAQAHVIGAATGKAIQIIDDAGATLGWVPLYA